MLDSNVLVLNRSYMPIHVTSARRAFSLIYQDIAQAVAGEYETFDFDAWRRLCPSRGEEVIGTPSGSIRVPRVILLRYYDRIPKRHIRYSRVNIFTRDKFTCQYCSARPPRSQLNLDHVIPRSLGGRTTWENVVASCVDCNRRKGGRTPHQARVLLKRKPERPRWTPLVNLASATIRYEEWQPFLSIVDGGARAKSAIDRSRG
ncbi:MAG: HNH endonuclease [Myxococcota bacterium]|jgi:5-methylcytosine-specific restriction endonuclease McrA|nr:HNH endonuclease [Deltaproteobacteria bacterium]MCP4245059.1 HNH endonuclease [bacterium]MDP6074078.1 HNH endonuclease [Myxococcota bacterium]MDP6242385.1 HNH endonuclease [Myxococcota bacterium]MDP7075164.1 HNH endonuclease [Myxococcota bacterium]